MTEPTDAELDAVLCKHWPAFSMQATLVRMWVRAAMRDAIAKWDTPPAEQQAMESVLVDGVAYPTPAPVAGELLRLHLELRAAATEAAPVVQPGAVYANKPDSVAWLAEYGGDVFTAAQLLNFADRTHAARLRCKSEQARLATLWGYVRADAAAKAAPAVPAGWKAVPVNPTPEMWKAAKTVPDPNPPYPPHYGLVWDAMLAASPTPTPTAEQQAAPKAAPGEPPGIQALMCVISSLHSLRDTAHFSDEEGELTNDLCTLRDWANAQTVAAPQPSPAAQADSVQEDAARLDWLEQNLFHREKDEWDTKFGGYKEYNMWVLFSPKGIQGSARNIIDAAREQGADHDR